MDVLNMGRIFCSATYSLSSAKIKLASYEVNSKYHDWVCRGQH
jgi:hypothetical protein